VEEEMIFGQAVYTTRPWFAWRPVRLMDGSWAWLTRVNRFRDGVPMWDFYFNTYSRIDGGPKPHP
jgi:hypothetical protein